MHLFEYVPVTGYCAVITPDGLQLGFVLRDAPALFYATVRAVPRAVPVRRCGMAVMRMLFTI